MTPTRKYVRTNLTLSVELKNQLEAIPDLNWSAIAEESLWAVVRGEQRTEQLVVELKTEVDRLRGLLQQVVGVAGKGV